MDAKTLTDEGIIILPVVHSDMDQIRGLQPMDWPDITLAYTYYIDAWFCAPNKLVKNEFLLGIGCLISFEKSAWLAQIIVHDSHRNQGWGGYITQYLMQMVTPQIKSISLLATAMGEPVYKKLGFEAEGEYTFYRNDKLLDEINSRNIEPFDLEFEDKLLELDFKVSGENRSRLLVQYLDNAWIGRNGNELLAFYLPSLGEGLIVSLDPDLGIELLELKLASKKSNVVPNQNIKANEFLSDRGYQAYRKATRMVKGISIPFRPQNIYSRIGGNLG